MALWFFRHLSHWPAASLGGPVRKNPPANAGHTRHAGSIPGPGRPPGEGRGSPLQCSGLGNSTDREPGELQPTRSQAGHDSMHRLLLLLLTGLYISGWEETMLYVALESIALCMSYHGYNAMNSFSLTALL